MYIYIIVGWYMCPIWLKMTNISFRNRIWTLISLFPILSPQSRSFIPLYESVRDVANHRVKQLRVVLLKLSSNLNGCENVCKVVAMTKKVGFWFKSNSKCHLCHLPIWIGSQKAKSVTWSSTSDSRNFTLKTSLSWAGGSTEGSCTD